jgi:hypothetical protein
MESGQPAVLGWLFTMEPYEAWEVTVSVLVLKHSFSILELNLSAELGFLYPVGLFATVRLAEASETGSTEVPNHSSSITSPHGMTRMASAVMAAVSYVETS